MKFKVGDEVWVDAPCWCGECIVIKMGCSNTIMYVRTVSGISRTIYRSWASIIRPKNQQLLFDFTN